MGFIIQPRTRVSAYRPISFRYEAGPTADAVSMLHVIVNDAGGNPVLEFRKPWVSRAGSGPTYTYRWEFDIQAILQRKLPPFSSERTKTFGDLDATSGLATGAAYKVTLAVNYEYRDGTTNLLTPDATVDESDPLVAFPITTQHNESPFLDAYLLGDNQIQFLTDMPQGVNICTGEIFSLSYIGNSDIDTIRVVSTYADGTTADSRVLIGGPVQTDENIFWIGVGPVTLNARTWSGSFADFAYKNPDGSPLVSYTVQLGAEVADFNPLTEIRRFTIEKCCGQGSMRVHFLNRRGGADAYTFSASKALSRAVKSGTAQRPLNWDLDQDFLNLQHDTEARGSFRTEIGAGDVFDLESRFISDAESVWLGQALESPEACTVTTGASKYTPLVIRDSPQTLDDSQVVAPAIKLVVALANDRIIQQY